MPRSSCRGPAGTSWLACRPRRQQTPKFCEGYQTDAPPAAPPPNPPQAVTASRSICRRCRYVQRRSSPPSPSALARTAAVPVRPESRRSCRRPVGRRALGRTIHATTVGAATGGRRGASRPGPSHLPRPSRRRPRPSHGARASPRAAASDWSLRLPPQKDAEGRGAAPPATSPPPRRRPAGTSPFSVYRSASAGRRRLFATACSRAGSGIIWFRRLRRSPRPRPPPAPAASVKPAAPGSSSSASGSRRRPHSYVSPPAEPAAPAPPQPPAPATVPALKPHAGRNHSPQPAEQPADGSTRPSSTRRRSSTASCLDRPLRRRLGVPWIAPSTPPPWATGPGRARRLDPPPPGPAGLGPAYRPPCPKPTVSSTSGTAGPGPEHDERGARPTADGRRKAPRSSGAGPRRSRRWPRPPQSHRPAHAARPPARPDTTA